jgi:hypothetical protein
MKKFGKKPTIPSSKKSTQAPEPVETQRTWIERGWYLVLEFELANSARFNAALEIAKKNPNFSELVDERGITFFRTIYFKKDFPKFTELYALVGAWKNTKLNFKGDDLAKEDFEIWFPSYQQYWGHRKILNESDFCGINKFETTPDFLGCYERNISLRWRDPMVIHYQYSSKVWYSFGKRVHELYRVDKQAMLTYLKTINEEFLACPCYGQDRIEHYVNKLPAEIDPGVHKEWQFKEDYLKLSAGRAFFNYDIAMSTMPDVCPVSEKAYEKFMNRIFKEGD